MKKIALLTVAAALAMPVVAHADDSKMPASMATAPASGTSAAMSAEKKMEMKDGSWAKVDAKGMVMVSKDGGATWMKAPDGTWEAKDGTKVTTKDGMKM